ncbi:hypothetical protein GCM10008090_33670 [Arenicella chitinivorans]|uniref:Type VI secretion system baseplate subunit TssG n=1 Tax=Arenicella chitinivorans TaxID=1329800 RepID=A0A918S212_9GAMM|nr:type VI secretion system baseplate subunit TssG [Arenicella chitinivorans]GHA20998.1 hypothetical protein GCM10008090_33670 [Arenicella chitinivorans]
MATIDGRESSSVRRGLQGHPSYYNFYQAVSLLAAQPNVDDGGLEQLDRHIRFKTEIGGQFPPNDIANIRVTGPMSEITVATFGLTGPLGPLPQQHSEWIDQESRHGRTALKDFMNLFEHRFIGLLYLIKKQTHQGLHKGMRSTSPIFRYLMNLCGWRDQDRAACLSQDTIARTLLPFAGLIAGGKTSAAAVANILSVTLGTSVRFGTTLGGFMPLDRRYRAVLATHKKGNQPATTPRLGDAIAIGRRSWNTHQVVNLSIGPLDYQQAETWLPGTDTYSLFETLIRFSTNGQWAVRAELQVNENSIPATRFKNNLRLGFNSWLKSKPNQSQSDQQPLRVTARIIHPTVS